MQDTQNAIDHLKNHSKFPATKAELIQECDDLSDFSDEDKNWFKQHLMDKTYKSADEVMETLGLMEG